jgi:hypothetical protein
MSMHIEGPWLSTTSTKKRSEKVTKAKQEEFERGWRERNARLRDMGLPKETFEQYMDWVYGRGKDTKKKTNNRQSSSLPVTKSVQTTAKGNQVKDNSQPTKADGNVDIHSTGASVPRSLGLWITGPVSSKQTPAYTGTKIIGIGTMHKSNAVPIFSDDEAKDISRMRR